MLLLRLGAPWTLVSRYSRGSPRTRQQPLRKALRYSVHAHVHGGHGDTSLLVKERA